jgi:hypothetical protein
VHRYGHRGSLVTLIEMADGGPPPTATVNYVEQSIDLIGPQPWAGRHAPQVPLAQAGRAHDCRWREAATGVRIEPEQLQAMRSRNVMVNAAQMLDLLNPQGMWRYIDRETEPMPQVSEDLDPLTGCKPVTAPQARQRPAS